MADVERKCDVNPEEADNIEETVNKASEDVKEDPGQNVKEETKEGTSDTKEETQEDPKEETQEDSEEGEKEKGSKFRRKDKKEKQDKKDEKIAELTDRVTRQMAEFDNFRKRTEKEKSQMFDLGAKNVIEKILPVVDNFERGLAAVPEENRTDSFVDGMDKIYKQMMAVLEEAGVKPIEAVGKEFDPNLHNAVMHVEDENFGENEIVEEFQKGYLYHESVVRHSMVKVAN
ncbi:MAG: nucleotide exchange factor GrpE [Lachnospiraceae bacterium]